MFGTQLKRMSLLRHAAAVTITTSILVFPNERRLAFTDVQRVPTGGIYPVCGLVSTYAAQGPRPRMEDRFVVSEDFRFFAIFDGHGGPDVAIYTKDRVMTYLEEELKTSDEDIPESLTKTFSKLSSEILAESSLDFQGSCAVGVYVTGTHLISANIGDSRAVLCRNGRAFDLTIDHKPNLPSERRRVTEMGGKVVWDGYLGPDRQPVPGMGAWRVNDSLAVSRALGDKFDTPYISSDPDIVELDRRVGDSFIVLGSDGLWDVMSSEECVKFVSQILQGSVGALEEGEEERVRRPTKSLNQWVKNYTEDKSVVRAVMDSRKSKMAQYLVEESLRRGSEDNVTVIVVWLK